MPSSHRFRVQTVGMPLAFEVSCLALPESFTASGRTCKALPIRASTNDAPTVLIRSLKFCPGIASGASREVLRHSNRRIGRRVGENTGERPASSIAERPPTLQFHDSLDLNFGSTPSLRT